MDELFNNYGANSDSYNPMVSLTASFDPNEEPSEVPSQQAESMIVNMGSQASSFMQGPVNSDDYINLDELVNFINGMDGTSSGYAGDSDASNWRFDTPSQIYHDSFMEPPMPPPPRQTARMSVRPPTETFRMPTPAELEEIYREVDQAQYQESSDSVSMDPYLQPYLQNNFWNANSVMQDLQDGRRDPPPRYGYQFDQPSSAMEWLDRSLRETDDVKYELHRTRSEKKHAGSVLKRMGKRLKRMGKALLKD